VVTLVGAVELLSDVVVVVVGAVAVVVADCVLVAAVADWAELAATVVVLCDASAGSWPVTSSNAINSQVARNSPTAPEATRRLIRRVRATRACLIDPLARSEPWGGELSVIVGSSRLRTAHLWR
jgi:hypothetical protein